MKDFSRAHDLVVASKAYRLAPVAALILVFGVTWPAIATTTYSDEASFFTAATPIFTEDFEDEPLVGTAGGGAQTAITFDYFTATSTPAALKVLDSPWYGNHNTTAGGAKYLSADTDIGWTSSEVTLAFDDPVSAFGLYFTDIEDGVTLTIGGSDYTVPGHASGGESYFGIIADDPFASVYMDMGETDSHSSMDDISLDFAGGVTITYSDEASFLAAAGLVATEDFEDEPLVGTAGGGAQTLITFDDFTATSTPAALKVLDSPWYGNHNTTAGGAKYLSADTDIGWTSSEVTLAFDYAISAFGLYLIDIEDGVTLTIGGSDYTVPGHGSGGESYFGIIAEDPFATVYMDMGETDSHSSIDDVSYAAAPCPVDVWVDDDWACQDDVNAYDPNLVWEYDAFNCIQDAIDAVCGSTVHVLAGMYNERLNINKSLVLLGAQAGVDPTVAGARTDVSAESIITEAGLSTPNPDVLIEIPAAVTGVTIDGFTLMGDPTNPVADTCVIRCWDDNIAISNNIIDGKYGVLCKGANGLAVERNYMVVNKIGVTVQPNPASNVTISGNVIELGSSPAGDESAIYITSTSNSSVTDNIATGFVNGKGVAGSNLTSLLVSGNTFPGNKDAVSFWGNTTFVAISHNVLSDCLRYGISIKGQDIKIIENIITGNGDTGVNVERHVIDTERVELHQNIISGNANYGVYVDTPVVTDIVDAEYNWWGDDSGPYDPAGTTQVPPCGVPVNDMKNVHGLGDMVSDNVDYCPWLKGRSDIQVITLPATNIGKTSATLNGQIVSDLGEPCQYRFWYWTQGAGSCIATPWSSDTKINGQSFSQDVSGLTPGSRYYFWAQAKNSKGESLWAAPKSFVTLLDSLQLIAPNGGQTLLAGSTYTISWRAEPTISDVLLEYSTDNGTSWNIIDTAANAELFTGHYGGSYPWLIPAESSCECLVQVSDASNPTTLDLSDATFCIVTQAVPDVVGMLQADAESAIISAGFVVGTITNSYNDTVPAGAVISQSPAGGTPAVSGTSVNLVISAGSLAAAPPTVIGRFPTDVGPSSAKLKGQISDDGGGACEYRFQYRKSGEPHYDTTAWYGYKVAPEVFSVEVTGLTPGCKYYYWAQAKNSAGEGPWSAAVPFVTPNP